MKKYDFCKMVGKRALAILRNDFGVDIQNLDVSENFKGQKYKLLYWMWKLFNG